MLHGSPSRSPKRRVRALLSPRRRSANVMLFRRRSSLMKLFTVEIRGGANAFASEKRTPPWLALIV
eukprot:scaffold1963_cov242-Pinguiococcus_pyrenoidosus.AAC.7